MAEALASTSSEDGLPLQWKLSNQRSRKSGCSNIFTGLNLHQLHRLFRTAGDRDAEHRAKLVWRGMDADIEGAQEVKEEEGEDSKEEAGLAQALVGLRVRARNKSGIRAEGHRDHKGLRASGYLRIEESLSGNPVEDEEADIGHSSATEEDISENQNPFKPSSWRLGQKPALSDSAPSSIYNPRSFPGSDFLLSLLFILIASLLPPSSPGVRVFEGESEAVVYSCQLDDGVLHYHPDYQPLKLQLELTVGVFRQRLCFKPPQPEICILVSIDEELKGANLIPSSMARSALRMISLNSGSSGNSFLCGSRGELPRSRSRSGCLSRLRPGLPAGIRTTEPGVLPNAPRGLVGSVGQ
ncbi:hypothetical protein FQN60_012254 [Etheostoma spectabile]|uniref:Arginine vasopressin-induced protein 1 n=1 Tax=Etheostoma spectabile TaxID=54343 RepID=A0A5J5DPB5_9PERO|nr:hypothetical protein FQN60_012254 [Etheostoma spectabile]